MDAPGLTGRELSSPCSPSAAPRCLPVLAW